MTLCYPCAEFALSMAVVVGSTLMTGSVLSNAVVFSSRLLFGGLMSTALMLGSNHLCCGW